MYGYAGKILTVDLTNQQSSASSASISDLKNYVGGIGLAAKFLANKLKPGVEPLGPENQLIVDTGPLAGTIAPTGGGIVFAAKSPLTGGMGLSSGQGFFASELKKAGFDALVIKGVSRKATYLWIDDDSVEFEDARELWGKQPTRTEEEIRKTIGDDSVRVASIGLAGEKLSRISNIIVDRTRTVGRTGIGAVMGSKNLKAIAVRGTADIEIADPDALVEFCRTFYPKIRATSAVKYYSGSKSSEDVILKDRVWETTFKPSSDYRDIGTIENLSNFNKLKCLPTRNFSADTFEGTEKIMRDYMNGSVSVKTQACSPCSISCEHMATIQNDEYEDTTARVEYQDVWAFGPQCGVDNFEIILKAIELCNKYGLDATSTGNVVGFTMDCYEKGILAYADTDRLDISFGNCKAMLELVRKIGCREGFGDVLAEGVKQAATKIGKGAESLANHIKGVEMTGYDLKCSRSMALGFAVSFGGADEDRVGSCFINFEKRINNPAVEKGMAMKTKDLEDLFAVMDSLLVCKNLINAFEGFPDLTKIYNIVTGFSLSPEELRTAGERISNTVRVFNCHEGFTRKEDSLPVKAITTPHGKNPPTAEITKGELDLMLDEYYKVRGWTKNGMPTQQKLEELGLSS